MLSKTELGTKHKCIDCNVLFYDLNKTTINCPACEQPHDVENAMRLKRTHIDKVDPVSIVENIDIDDKETDLEMVPSNDDDDTILENTSDLDPDNPIPSGIIINNEDEQDS